MISELQLQLEEQRALPGWSCSVAKCLGIKVFPWKTGVQVFSRSETQLQDSWGMKSAQQPYLPFPRCIILIYYVKCLLQMSFMLNSVLFMQDRYVLSQSTELRFFREFCSSPKSLRGMKTSSSAHQFWLDLVTQVHICMEMVEFFCWFLDSVLNI